ncbi:GNAT family N-acetyltransferase [Clavibacter michiganensis]|nr:GNAT family N-acetyltransferase [Clavibacter michiganensis]OQJ58484.1 GNAT family N-acetyltransferase [Clavibacter michiganensis subsp. insidiosus]RII85607.1 GNAT family N-acetyltransferase [Clavibacter michiganensis subsp. insidiosus]RMC86239.1 GNAT family N-acetyltransferase [Clavibacter michiganensis subsp. insidiosus]
MMALAPVASAADVATLHAFLAAADLTVTGLDDPGVWLCFRRDADGRISGSTGFELSADGRHALIRSVAVGPALRSAGLGSTLARHALAAAADAGAERAWLFSRRSGPFWRGLGFQEADRDALAAALPDARQVVAFRASGQLAREVAWSRALGAAGDATT